MRQVLYFVTTYRSLILMSLMLQYTIAVGTNMQQLRRQHDTQSYINKYKNHKMNIEKEFRNYYVSTQNTKLTSQRRNLGMSMSKYYHHDMPDIEGNNTSTTDQQPTNKADTIEPTRSPFKSAKVTSKAAPISKSKLLKKKKSKDSDKKDKIVNKKQMIGGSGINVETRSPSKAPIIESSNAPEGNIQNVKSMSTKKMEKGKSYFVERTRTPITSPTVLPNNMKPEAVSPVTSSNITFAPYVSVIPPTPTQEPVKVVPLTPEINNNTLTPTSNQPSVDEQYVSIPEYYIAFAAPMADREPSFDEYYSVTQITTSYFEEIFTNTYNSDDMTRLFTFVRIENNFLTKQYQMNIPTSVYNIYMTFNTTFVFAVPSNNTTTTTVILPNSQELLLTMDEAIGANYVTNYIHTSNSTTTTPFDLTLDAVLNPIELSTNMSNDTTSSEPLIKNNTSSSSSSSSISPLEGRFILPTGLRITNRTFPHDG